MLYYFKKHRVDSPGAMATTAHICGRFVLSPAVQGQAGGQAAASFAVS